MSKRKGTTKIAHVVPQGVIESQILLIRGKKVMLDRDLARLYKVTTGRLNEQVKRNRERFPDDFMFQLTVNEFEHWRSQIAISKSGRGKKGLSLIKFAGSLMRVPAYIKSKNQRYYGQAEHGESYCHFLTPFKVISPAIRKSRAPKAPNMNITRLSGMLVNTYMATMSFEMSRRYLPKFVIWLSLNSMIKEYRASQYLSRGKSATKHPAGVYLRIV